MQNCPKIHFYDIINYDTWCEDLMWINYCIGIRKSKNNPRRIPKNFEQKQIRLKMNFLRIEDETMRKHSMLTIGNLVDNRMVVTHNLYLLRKFDCYISVEYCTSEMAFKYIRKYIHKWHHSTRMHMTQHETNEVQKYIDSRYVGPMQTAWRLNSLPLHCRNNSVVRIN